MKLSWFKEKLPYIFIVLLFIGDLLLNSLMYYAKIRFGWIAMFSEILTIASLVLILYAALKNQRLDVLSITQKLRFSLILVFLIYVVGYVLVSMVQPEYITPRYSGTNVMKPNSWSAVLVANLIGMTALASLCLCLVMMRSLIFYRRKKNTPTYFYLFVFFGGLTMLSASIAGKPLKYDFSYNHFTTSTLLVITTFFLALNAVRVGWVTVLNRRQKFLTFLGGIVFTLITAGLHGADIGTGVTFSDMVNSYSIIAGSFLFLVTIFIFIYSLVVTTNALFHLPTAAIYDKKVREINSIYSLSRTINSLFDVEKIVQNVTELVCDTTRL